jgi:gamma-glutamyltranspeptidase / glutathione hydrolase
MTLPCRLMAALLVVWLEAGAATQCSAHYAVATANAAATDAGMEILAMGGSAADAAVAIQMVLCVVEPQSSGIGGGAIALYRDARTRGMTAFDGLAKSPSAYDKESADATGFAHTGSAVAVPGTLRVLEVMHRRHGRLSWRVLLARAIAVADGGFAVSPYLARSLAAAVRAGMKPPEWLTDSAGKPASQGARVRNPALADTLRAVAAHGVGAIYGGLADQLVAAVQPGGRMTVGDLAGYKVVEREPLCLALRRATLCSFPPPSYGGVAVLETLGILERTRAIAPSFLDLRFVHRFIEAGRIAEADRMDTVGDPDKDSVSVSRLLTPAHLMAQATRIKDNAVMADPRGEKCRASDQPPEPSTSQVSVVDRWGNALAMTTTINVNFGSWLTVGGFFLNDAMTNFSRTSTGDCSANTPAGGKRPATAMAPVIALDAHGSVVLIGGSAGAGEIVDYVSQAVIALSAGERPAQALDDGHVSTARAPYSDTASEVELEPGRAISQLSSPLAAMGHRVRIAPLPSGTAFVVSRPGGWQGAADPRRDGTFAVSP